MSDIMAVSRFERLFRRAAGLDVDKNDLRRLTEFLDQKLYDLLLVSQAAAKSNARDVIRPWDLPLTKGLQESMHAFRELDEELELAPILEQLAKLPHLDLEYDEEVRAMLPQIVGGLTVALAWTFRTLDPNVKNPDTTHWDRAIEIFNRLL
jgi:hypothetical protein